ncbi:hypothetical protein MKMG_01791 [Methanogenium sp. MK-MG]|nr:hypothetical protein MKMG_01791 [Methanogenium sp. MK-MG]
MIQCKEDPYTGSCKKDDGIIPYTATETLQDQLNL